ncbi:MAG: hypothetical protein HY520_01880 [Candidatus Aenigmarchaeota archaeon]|nr:hypothetical protein [Candidatus Aenigmarchaeota archaeon]
MEKPEQPADPFGIITTPQSPTPHPVGGEACNALHLRRIPHDAPEGRRWKAFLTADTGEEVDIRPLAEGEPGLRLYLHRPDGTSAPLTTVSQLRLCNERFGELRYGLHPQGYGTWAFYEAGGGGSVVVPYFVRYDDLYVGVVLQERPFQNRTGPVANVPRGFLGPDLDHLKAAMQEGAEEMRIKVRPFHESVSDAGAFSIRLHPLAGRPGNPNSTFFIHDATVGEGIHFYGAECNHIEIATHFITSDHPVDIRFTVERNLEIRYEPEQERLLEAIHSLTFVHEVVASQVGDLITNAAVARLRAHLALRELKRVQ